MNGGARMAGQIKKMIDEIIKKRANGDSVLIKTTTTKLVLKGINPDKFTSSSEDDPLIMEKLKSLAKDLNITF
jgi:DNA polymerase III sliding clamp (beta) subunit (PCNA family)